MSGNRKGKIMIFFLKSPHSHPGSSDHSALLAGTKFENAKKERPLELSRKKKGTSDVESTKSKEKNYSLQSFSKLS